MNLKRRVERLEAPWMCQTHRQPYQCLACDTGDITEAEQAEVEAMLMKIGPERFPSNRWAKGKSCLRCGAPVLCLACQEPSDQIAYLEAIGRLTADEQHRLADILEKVAGRR